MKLFCALDKPNANEAWLLYQKIKPITPFFKVGLQLYTAEGPDFVRRLVKDGAQVFLDLKFHDIPNTVAGAVASAVQLKVLFTNIHLCGGEEMVRAAVAAAKGTKTKILGVTVLTSLEAKAAQVKKLAQLGKKWGIDGVVCSAKEVSIIHKACGKNFITMVPGIRPISTAKMDQKRIVTPQEAKRLGADYIVVGRPISEAKNPQKAAQEILLG